MEGGWPLPGGDMDVYMGGMAARRDGLTRLSRPADSAGNSTTMELSGTGMKHIRRMVKRR